MNTVPRLTVLALATALLIGTAVAFGADTPPGAEQSPAAPPAPVEAAPAPAPAESAPASPSTAPSATPAETAPVPESAAPVPAADKAPAPPATMEQMQAEVSALREDMRMLQSTLDLMVNKIMADLREENEQLRDEVRRLNTLRGTQGMPDVNSVPRPAGAAVDQALSEPQMKASPPPPPFKFTVVREWGRSAEEAQKLGGEAQSLKGMIGVVPAGSLREDVEKLARDLRRKYDGFDNINIEVFDDPVTANQFAANRAADPEHRVLSVSRHKASNRDAIVLLANGRGEMISADPNEPLPPQQPDDMPTLSVTNPMPPGQAKRPQAAEKEAPVETAASATGQNPPAVQGQWVKEGKKERAKGPSRKGKGEPKEEPPLPENQRPMPEGPPVLVPHEPDPDQPQFPPQPETKVYEAPPGVPVEQQPAEEDRATAPPGKDNSAVDQEKTDTPRRNPKNPFGPRPRKNK